MSDRPTPRTDEFIRTTSCDWWHCVAFARQLERELAEMEEQAQYWANQSMSWKLKADVLSRERVKVEEPRKIIDELKGRLRLAESERDTWHRLAVSSEVLLKKAETERDNALAALEGDAR